MFDKILHANDGSEHAFHALTLALVVAKQNNSELHMISVEEIDYMPAFIEEVREETGTAARRFHSVLQRARAMAQEVGAGTLVSGAFYLEGDSLLFQAKLWAERLFLLPINSIYH